MVERLDWTSFATAQNRWALVLFLALISHDGADIWGIENPGAFYFHANKSYYLTSSSLVGPGKYFFFHDTTGLHYHQQ